MKKHLVRILLPIALCSGLLIANSCGPDPSVTELQSELAALKAAQNQSSISGIVRDDASNTPLASVRVKIDDKLITTDEDGFYQQEGLSPGKVKVTATKDGYELYEMTLSLVAGARVEDIALTKVTPTEGSSSIVTPPSSISLPENPEVSPSTPPNGEENTGDENASDATPDTSPTPILLDPSGNPTTAPTPSASSSTDTASPDPDASAEPEASDEPEPSPTPLYDPAMDAALQSDLLVTRKPTGLELSFILQKQDGSPIPWAWGDIDVEYFVATANNTEGSFTQGDFLTSGRTRITKSNDPFTVTLNSSQLGSVGSHVYVNYTLDLPDERKFTRNDPFSVN